MPQNQPPAAVPIQVNPVQQPVVQAQPVQPMFYGTTQQPMMHQNILIAQESGNGSSTTGLVMGILALSTFALGLVPFLCFFLLFSWLFAILAIVFGHIGHAQGNKSGTGAGQGIAGFILGYLTLFGYALPFILLGSIGASDL
jgi:hypothetical protein